jgi:hypothetical protein
MIVTDIGTSMGMDNIYFYAAIPSAEGNHYMVGRKLSSVPCISSM